MFFRNHRVFPFPHLCRWASRACAIVIFSASTVGHLKADLPSSSTSPPSTLVSSRPKNHFYIRSYRVQGNSHLISQTEFEQAVYPFLGPYRTADDVEEASQALQQVYHEKGYQTVIVQPDPIPRLGVVTLQVIKNPVGRLRITGSRYFSLDEIRRQAPSLQEGTVPNFNQVQKDLVVLSESPDRRVTPSLQAGLLPGTVDMNLEVKDTPPIHGSLELNNQYSIDTTPLRINGAVSYDNLWQLEHSIGFSFQVSPEDLSQVQVFSGYYLARIPGIDGVTFTLQGTDQDSNVSTLGGIGIVGKGDTVGLRATFALPHTDTFYESVTVGLDYKHFTQDINDKTEEGAISITPVTYFPLSAAYSGNWAGKGYETDLNSSVNIGLRTIGGNEAEFELNRHGASGNFIYVRGDLSHTHELPGGLQAFVTAQGQAADQPLLNSEQFSGGGLGTVRGLLESEVLGDNGLLGTVELRSPSLGNFLGKEVNDWRVYIFTDGGILTQNEPLVETPYEYNLLSVGAGTRIKLLDHLNGSLDVGVPIVVDSLESNVPAGAYVQNPIQERPYDARLTFRVWAEF
jgi:hemolysin activation/secretion protein